jgi:hypothetical protein
MKIYAFFYNPDTWESAAIIISLHLSKDGAEIAMQNHKQKESDEYDYAYRNDLELKGKYNENKSWSVIEINLLP